MMKKFAVLFITLLFSTMASALPLRFEKGVHYEVISKVASDKPTLTEYFSFYCPHCYKFEGVAKELEKGLPAGAKFNKSHVDFMRSATPEVQQSLSKAMVVAEKMGIGHKMIDAIFDHIHGQRKPFTNEADIRALFAAKGADTAQFDKLINSFGVKGAAKRMKTTQDDLASRNILTSVPMFIVNDKYKLLPQKLKSLNDYKDLVEFLLTLK